MKINLRRSSAFIMTLVMLLSTVLLYAPSFAWGGWTFPEPPTPPPTFTEEQLEGENIVPTLKALYSGGKILLSEAYYEEGGKWNPDTLYTLSGSTYVEIYDTSGLFYEGSDYKLVVVDAVDENQINNFVTLTVYENNPPEWNDPLLPPVLTVDEGGIAQFDWAALVNDPEGLPLSLVGSVVPSLGYFTDNGDDTLTYHHDGSEPNPDGMDGTITFTASDGILQTTFVYEIVVNEIPDSDIGINLGPVTGTIPNQGTINELFVQQGQPINLWQAVTYGLVGNDYPANKVIEEKIDLQMIAGQGYVAPEDDMIIKTNGQDNEYLVSLNSYGRLLMLYYAKDGLDPQNEGANETGRYITINHQPQIDLIPISPDDPFNNLVLTGEVDATVNYYDMTFNLLDYVYMYDFEEYEWNYMSPIGDTLPDGMRITFWYGDTEYELSQIWDVLYMPCGEPFTPSKVFGLEFMAYDTWGGVSDKSETFYLEVVNNEPYFIYDGLERDDGYLIPTVDDLYTTVGASIDLYQGITWYDVEHTYMSCPVTKVMEWKLVDDVTYSTDSFPFDERGFYDVKFTITDGHGATASIFRKVEVNTIPLLTNNGPDVIIRQVEDPLEPYVDIESYDDDAFNLDPVDYMNMMQNYYATHKFNFLAGIETFEPYSGPIDMTVRGRYLMENKVWDPWFEEAIVPRELWVNEAPEIYVPDRFVIIKENDPFDVDSSVAVTDFEDDYLYGIGDLLEPIDYDVDIYVYASQNGGEGTYVSSIDTSYSAIYFIDYSTEDSMGGVDEETVVLWVVEEPVVTIEKPMVEMEVNGLFPTYNGVKVNFWHENDLKVDRDNENGDVRYDFYAMIGEDPIEPLHQFTDTGIHYIDYVAVMEIWDDGEWHAFYNTVTTRTVVVTDELEGEVVYASDFVEPDFMFKRSDVYETCEYMSYDVYPVLMKYNPTTNEERLVTAIVMNYMQGESDNDIILRAQPYFDDIAVLSNGDVYGLRYHSVYKLNEETSMFDWLFNVETEVMEVADFTDTYVPMDFYNLQSMTADENDFLVIATGYVPFLNPQAEIDSIYDFDHALLYFDPDVEAYMPVLYDTVTREEPFYFYFKGIGLIELGKEMMPSYQPYLEYPDFDTITDIAFNDDLTAIYGIGGNRGIPFQLDSDLSQEFWDSILSEEYFTLFELKEFEMMEPDADAMFFVKFFEMTKKYYLDYGHTYKGIATLGEDIYLTSYASPFMDVAAVADDVIFPYYETFVSNFTMGDEGFVDLNDHDLIDGMFDGALGAASTYDRYFTLTPFQRTVIVGYGQGSLVASFTAEVFPETAYGEVTWAVTTNASLVVNNGDGTFTVDANSNDATVEIKASALNKATGLIEERSGQIIIDRRSAPPQPTPTPTPTVVVGVTLDIDAITLEYGDTAVEENTFYDFTETVTGTTDKRVTWSLDDDTYATVDENGVVTVKDDVEAGTGDIVVELTVTTVVGGATDTAEIIFEEQAPLGAIEFFDPYIYGYTDNTFRPKNFVTRAEVATMFSKILKLNTEFPGSQKFSDVNPDFWAYNYIQAMYRTGIFAGYMDGDGSRYFDPNAPISRAEIAQVFSNYWNFLDISVTDTNMQPIPDVPSSFWAANAINRLYNTGIFTGYADGSFNPYASTLREQIVTMINKLIARPPNEPDASKFTDILPTHEHYGDIEAASQTFLKAQGE